MSYFIILFIVFFLSASLGSFFKLVVDRYNTGESITIKPSYCELTKTKLAWWQNVPIFGYIILGGRSAFNGERYGLSYLIAEIIPAFLITTVFLSFDFNDYALAISTSIFLSILILLSYFDYKHAIVPHEITYTGILIVIITSILFGNGYYYPIYNLGIAFLMLDILQFFASTFKGYQVEDTFMPFLLIIWSACFLFFGNLYFLILPIVLFVLLIALKINVSPFVKIFWLVYVFLFFFLYYQFQMIEFNILKLQNYFLGVGIIYLICEVFSFYAFSFVPALADSNEEIDTKIVIGGGDVTVFALIGAFLGVQNGFFILFIASLLAISSHLLCIVFKMNDKHKGDLQYLPFVPFLTAATVIVILING